jgi:glycosyltransferase 2 family protein
MSRPGLLLPRLRALLPWVGVLLVLLSLGFVAVRIEHQLGSLRELLSLQVLLLLGGGALVYGASLLLISHAFWLLLRWQGAHGISLVDSHRIYGRTQIAKYLPGNVFQFVARHVAYRVRGVGDGALGLAALYETLGLAGAAACLALLGLPFLGVPLIGAAQGQLGVALALAVGLGAALCGVWLIPRLVAWLQRRRGQAPLGAQLTARNVASLLPFYGSFFLISGALALSLHTRASPSEGVLLSMIPGYALAWLCGFVVPGASAGLGVREAVIVLLLGEDPAALFTAMGMRVITTLGDALLLLGVTLWTRRAPRAEEQIPG